MSVLDLEAELNTSRAETAAAKLERDACRVQAEAHAAKLVWYLEQDEELRDRALKDAEHLLRPYLTSAAVFGFTPDHRWRESSTPFVVIAAVQAVFIRAETAEAALAAANARAEALETKLAKVTTIKEVAASIQNMAAMREPDDARNAISRLTVIEADAARILRLCALAEIEGTSP